MVKDRLVVFVEGVDADVRGARIIVLIERSDTGLALVQDILAILQQRLGLVECNHQRRIRAGGLDGGCAQISFMLLSDRPRNVKITPDWRAAQCRNRWPRK